MKPANMIAMFSRWAKLGLSDLLNLPERGLLSSSLDGSSSSSIEPTRHSALDDFQRIMQRLPRIQAVLEDAEERDIQDKSVNLWLSELWCLAYDIDDVIDEHEYDVLIAQMKAEKQKSPATVARARKAIMNIIMRTRRGRVVIY
ncbi:hypothetical protein KFK09_000975 [Dendrobium nobile]|uniref:Disease resistance N-terminal domain-containing protein n=1 Tax=Dendrobium nobile TaxID=94219 RepID=A0A8T3CGG4_DENNO|nr:hypothetical protein KFK09_000975 [Dendrobium nobile]